jgi:acetyl esterase/lipase
MCRSLWGVFRSVTGGESRRRRREAGVAGEDSGAHLAALLAAERRAGVIGTALIGGFFDLTAFPAVRLRLPADFAARASPINTIASAMPPVLVVHGGADTEAPVAQARRYCDAVARRLERCRFVEVAGASHRRLDLARRAPRRDAPILLAAAVLAVLVSTRRAAAVDAPCVSRRS